jgi:hypothetical protein
MSTSRDGEALENNPYIDFVVNTHSLYGRYHDDWKLCINSWWGGVEYKNAQYLRAYSVDLSQPGESVNMYTTDSEGNFVGKSRAKMQWGNSKFETERGADYVTGSFYKEKLDNTPLYNYVKLIVAEYNAMLFRNPPQRYVGDSVEAARFLNDVDQDGNSINEFMSLVDVYTTVFGVCHVSCLKPIGSDIPKWMVHTPLDITNWEYAYDTQGSLKLRKLVIKLDETDEHTVYRYLTSETIETVFVGVDKENYTPPVESTELQFLGDGVYRVVQPNELGYIPVQTFYQSTKIYNNVGTTVIQDVAQIQRSIYGDMAEIYNAITYSAHPTLLCDEQTDQLNDGQVGAEPGSVVKVQNSLTGEPNYVFEFKSPPLDAITEIRDLVDNKVQKLSQVAMLRSEDLIKAANSGAQIEVFDDKLSAMVRRKATNLENGEAKLWEIWFDWLNMPVPEEFSISYNRQYNRRALEIELKEVDLMMATLEKYELLMEGPPEEPEAAKMPMELPNIPGRTYADGEAIPATLPALYVEAGLPGTGPGQNCYNCGYYAGGMCGKFQAPVRENYWCAKWEDAAEEMAEDAAEQKIEMQEDAEELAYEEFKTNARNKIRERLEQLFNASTTDNGF